MSFDLLGRLQNLIVLVLSLTVHEFFHAWTAWRLGDDTAARLGRKTLNPIPHIDLLGTLILPLVGAPIGWAKPVPVNPANFRRGIRMSTGDLLVSIAGPLSNLGLAVLSALIIGLMIRFTPGLIPQDGPAEALLNRLALTNIGLAIFNLLPLPPLDGGHVVGSLIPYRWRSEWETFQRVAPIILLVLLAFPMLTGSSVLMTVLGPPQRFVIWILNHLIGGIAS